VGVCVVMNREYDTDYPKHPKPFTIERMILSAKVHALVKAKREETDHGRSEDIAQQIADIREQIRQL